MAQTSYTLSKTLTRLVLEMQPKDDCHSLFVFVCLPEVELRCHSSGACFVRQECLIQFGWLAWESQWSLSPPPQHVFATKGSFYTRVLGVECNLCACMASALSSEHLLNPILSRTWWDWRRVVSPLHGSECWLYNNTRRGTGLCKGLSICL